MQIKGKERMVLFKVFLILRLVTYLMCETEIMKQQKNVPNIEIQKVNHATAMLP